MKVKRRVPLVLAGVVVALCLPGVAASRDLVDDPKVAGRLPAIAKAYFMQREAEYRGWLDDRRRPQAVSRVLPAPYRTLATTSHKQARNDYCVPATTTIIDHFLRGASNHWTQNQWAAYRYGGVPLWTDAGGGNMWVMAMGLKSVTGAGYAYSSDNTATSVCDRTEYAILGKGRPVAYGVRIDHDEWPNYRIDHQGHILCGRGFDWRLTGRIYIDDPYPENAPPPLGYGGAGGDTYGQKTYAKNVVVGGVLDSASRQVVY